MPKKATSNKSKILKGAAFATAAGVAVGAAAIALSNKKTRAKIKKGIKTLEKEGTKELDTLIEKVKEAKSEGEKRIKKTVKSWDEKLNKKP